LVELSGIKFWGIVQMKIRLLAALFFLLTTSFLTTSVSWSQGYPNKPVKIVVGFVAGGAPDFVARALSNSFSEQLGQSFFVDNKPGAGGSLSTAFVAKSPADGSTLLLADTATLMLAPHLFKSAPMDTMKDFSPIGMITTEPLLIVSNAKTGIKSLNELIRIVKTNPGKLSYGSSGVGSIHHISMEVFKSGAGLDITHIPFKGSGQSILAVVAGDVPLSITAFSSAGPHITSGALNLLAVTSSQRVPTYPDVPSISEVVKDYDYVASFGLLAPIGTSNEVISKLSRALKITAESREFNEKFKGQSTLVKWTSPEDYKEYLRINQQKYERAANDVNLQPN
jgi:tripartite-type tricarboxylate transporter receptor subunit TctC